MEIMSTIKVFKVNDYEWWAGPDLETIKTAYQDQTGIDPESDEGFDHPRELGDDEMRRKTIWFEEGEEPDSATFRGTLGSHGCTQSRIPLSLCRYGVLT